MNAIRQRCRPKHQVLVLKCYPRHQKNNVEVKPNSSELSYLLYYASTRRSKLQKVGDFLDKRTASDVWKGRIGHVQVTLHILKALIEKCPRDLPLYAGSLLKIFRTILRSLDVTMIEETVPTFATFCAHQDPAVLAADQDYIRQYEEIVRLYASFASKDTPVQAKSAKSVPVLIRFRKAGLGAIKAIAESESLSSETGRQLSLIVPVVLENIYADRGQYLVLLEHREGEKVEFEKEIAFRRRQSTSTVRTAEPNHDPAAASGSTEAADILAEQETGLIALQALKKIFAVVPKAQLRLATSEVLKFMTTHIKPHEHFIATTAIPMQSGSWPCTLFAMICSWAAVQDRYVILVTAVEDLIRSPLGEGNMEKQWILATIIGWLLSSDINFIGLSIMDVLVGLIQHILELFHQAGPGPFQPDPRTDSRTGDPEKVQDEVEPLEKSPDTPPLKPTQSDPHSHHHHHHHHHHISPARVELLVQLQRCIGCLAVHVYYSDQVSDMITAILSRLKPSSQSAIPSSTSTVENGNTAVDGVRSSSSLAEKPSADGFFSFDSARVAALSSIKEILFWANWTKSDGSSASAVRGHISIEKWEGTQWLLRDHSWKVRTAYVETLLVWMRFELKKPDLRIRLEIPRRSSKSEKRESNPKENSLARRAVSNASQQDRSPKRQKSNFLQLLHLAIYDNAHQYATSECDILLLHLLLSQLVSKLGANSIQHGLPMVMRIQDDTADLENFVAKINLSSLVYGYLWAISVYFNFDASATGRSIHDEVNRRTQNQTWLEDIRIPPLPIDEVVRTARAIESDPPSREKIDSSDIKPFENRAVLVDKIAEGYSVGYYSPPNSPPSSPARNFALPILSNATASSMIPTKKPAIPLPQFVKDSMLSDWTREACIAATTKQEGSRSGSLSGSPTATGSGKHLTVNVSGSGANGVTNGESVPSPRRGQHPHQPHHLQQHSHSPFRGSRPSSGAFGLLPPHNPHALRDALLVNSSSPGNRSRRGSQSPTPLTTTSSGRSAVRVEDLKRVLSGVHIPALTGSSAGHVGGDEQNQLDGDDTASESMVSYDGSDASFVQAARSSNQASKGSLSDAQMSKTDNHDRANGNQDGTTTPRASNTTSVIVPRPAMLRRSSVASDRGPEEIPPVPPLPANLPLASHPVSSPSLTPTKPTLVRPNTQQSTPVSTIASPAAVTDGDTTLSRVPTIIPISSRFVPPTGPNKDTGATVRDSLRRSISTSHGVSTAFVDSASSFGHWNALDLLDEIEAGGASMGSAPGTAVPSTGRLGKGIGAGGSGFKPPY